MNQIFFVLEASGKFQSRGKTYSGLEIFMTDFEEQLVKSPEHSFEQLVEGTEFMVGMTQAGTEAEWSRRYPNLKTFWGLGMKLPRWCKSRKPRHGSSSRY
ncbi:hypothetical protein JCGZ_24243 [Jatropha curcas]|uniref:Uncharacterized protein n=1 Tax=Jatropha curcas TaxID=180498 RepID=A0A067JQN2_JATCU|nr:hypothetical protein JCGZ_24243 [Jatropha curcas]